MTDKVPFVSKDRRPTYQPDEAENPIVGLQGGDELEQRAREVLGLSSPSPADCDPDSEQIWEKCFRHSEAVHSTELSGETVVVHLETGFYYTLNSVGTFMWSHFGEGKTLREILESTCNKFEIAREAAASDLMAFVRSLREERLVD